MRYDGILEVERSFAVWISDDDASHVPLRVELGSEVGVFVAELVTYQGPPERRP